MAELPAPARILGQVKPLMPEITVYPMAEVGIEANGLGIGDATHYLRITLPVNAREIRVPFNRRSMIALGDQLEQMILRDQQNTTKKGKTR